MNTYYEKYVKAYQATPKGKYIRQRANAQQRGIEWKLSFEEWWSIWEKSGKWAQRGRKHHEYVMGRIHDEGPYEVGNVKIITQKENSLQGYAHGLGLFKTGELKY